MPPRPERSRLATSSDGPSTMKTTQGPLTTTVEISGTFYGGGTIRRTLRFYRDHPRIDFETELNDIPNFTVVVADFPLGEEITEIRRGIPFGFSHGAWSKPNRDLHGWTKGIVPAVRWTHYQFNSGGGFAIFDRGCSGREINDRTPIIYLLNAEDKYNGYPNPWLSGKGKHVLSYSIVAHDEAWRETRIPQMAWEYNSQPILVLGSTPGPTRSFVETSPNLILEAMRCEGDHIELRLVECLGLSGAGTVKLHLPHSRAALTDALGQKKSAWEKSPQYEFPLRPQQIVTMQFETTSTVPIPEPITAWDPFVPKEKLPALHAYDPNLIGHPPFGS
jgi:alpha-mannosidase